MGLENGGGWTVKSLRGASLPFFAAVFCGLMASLVYLYRFDGGMTLSQKNNYFHAIVFISLAAGVGAGGGHLAVQPEDIDELRRMAKDRRYEHFFTVEGLADLGGDDD